MLEKIFCVLNVLLSIKNRFHSDNVFLFSNVVDYIKGQKQSKAVMTFIQRFWIALTIMELFTESQN